MRSIAVSLLLLAPSAVFAQQPAAEWPSPLPITAGQAPAPPVADGLPVRVLEVMEMPNFETTGQQHWVALNLVGGQPSVGRIEVKVWPRDNDSLWLEAYGGSALYDGMYGFGARVHHTCWTFEYGDSLSISPGLGVQVLPDWYTYDETLHYSRRHGYWVSGYAHWSSLTFLAGDVDFSW